MENEFEFTKSMPGYTTVQKCLAACAKQDYSGVTRADYDTAIDAVAKAIADEHSVTYAEALTRLMVGGEGRALYAGREECPATGSGSPVQKVDAVIAKREEQEQAATNYAQSYKVPLAEARRMVGQYYAEQN